MAFPKLVSPNDKAVPPVRDTALSSPFRFEPPLASSSAVTPIPIPKSGMTHVFISGIVPLII
jgi:hypothetical protein